MPDEVAMRAMPSGMVHRWVSREKVPASILIYMHTAACGREMSDRRLTADFPDGCRRCPACYPEEGDDG